MAEKIYLSWDGTTRLISLIKDDLATKLELNQSGADLSTALKVYAQRDSENDNLIKFYQGESNVPYFTIDTTDFLIDGMLEDVQTAEDGLTFIFNTDAGKDNIFVPYSKIFDPTLYYTKTEIDSMLDAAVGNQSDWCSTYGLKAGVIFYTTTDCRELNLTGKPNITFSKYYPRARFGVVITSVSAGTTNIFQQQTTLKTLTYHPDFVTTVNADSFNGCTALEYVEGIENVTTVGARAFVNCNALRSLIFKNDVTFQPTSFNQTQGNNYLSIYVPKTCYDTVIETVTNPATKIESRVFPITGEASGTWVPYYGEDGKLYWQRNRDGEPTQGVDLTGPQGPQGPKGTDGNPGKDGKDGQDGAAAGFGTPTAQVSVPGDGTVAPSVVITTSGPDTAKVFAFDFKNIKGAKGADGEPGAPGEPGKDGVSSNTNMMLGTQNFTGDNWVNLHLWEETGEIYRGCKVLKRDKTSSGVYQLVPVEAGKTYVFSAYMRVDDADVRSQFEVTSETGDVTPQDYDFPDTTEWTRQAISFKCNISGNIGCRLYKGSGNGAVYIAGMKLEEGTNTNTVWMPAPEEMIVEAISLDDINSWLSGGIDLGKQPSLGELEPLN